ncbi:hypothetical protein [Paenibacillus sp. GCM10023250]|uniref:hypothetical protein n=1 Tax=Paenibacillus sp. GCM10023250 TaxID=3252648 RepID=UPI00361EA35E
MNDNQKTTGTEVIVPSQAEKIKYWTSLMPRIGFGLMLIGIIMSACFVHDFKDTNLGLMIGFGFIIGGIQVLLLGSLFHALQPKFAKEQQAAPASQQPERV